MKKNKTLIVYHYVALYRKAVFSRLINDKELDATITSDLKSNNDIKTIQLNSTVFNKNHKKIHNVWFSSGILWQRGLIKLLLSGNYGKIIFLGDPHFISTWVSLILSRFKRIDTYIWTHGFIGRSGVISDTIKLLMYRLAKGILLYGEEAKNDLIKAGVKKEKLHVIYNSLDYNHQKNIRNAILSEDIIKLRNSLFNERNLLQIIFVGRLTHHKRLDMLIKAVSILNNTKPRVNLVFVGNGQAIDNLKDMTLELNIQDHVLFYGACHNEEQLAKLFCSSDVCVSPGEIGLTAMHSLAYGVPIITHNNKHKQMPEYEAVIEDVTGFLFEYGSIDSLVEKIAYFINNPIDNVSTNCINIIEEKYNPEIQTKLIKKALSIPTYEN